MRAMMSGTRLRRSSFGAFLTACILSCDHPAAPTSRAPGDVRQQLVDARSGGQPGFYFLPPLAPATTYSGAFDENRNPTVEICVLDTASACAGIITQFTASDDRSTRIRVSEDDEAYIVNWATRSELSLSSVYRVRVLEGSTELGHADVVLLKSARDAKDLPPDLKGVVRGSTLPIKFRIGVNSTAPAVRLEVHPSTFILPSDGSVKQLHVRAYDANGNLTNAPVTWSSSAAATIDVDGNGLATAKVTSGSAQITARAGSVVSNPALGLVMQPPSGALLISDENVVGSIQPVDANTTYGPGWRYTARVRGVTPTIGQIILSTGEAPIGGRIISAAQVGDSIDLVIELITMNELFGNLSLSETIALSAPPTTNLAARSNFATFEQVGAGARPRNTLLASDTEFELGPFECKITAEGPSLTPQLESFSFHVDPDYSLEIVHTPQSGLEKLVVRGTVDAGLTVKPIIPLDVEEKVECKTQVAVLLLGGPVGLFVGGQVPVGVGFELGGKIVGANIGIDVGVTFGATMAIGFDCTSVCAPVGEISGSRNGYIKPVLPVAESSGRLELSGSAFVWAEAKIGNPFLEMLQFKTFDAKIGLTQKFDLANKSVQVLDTAYASKAELTFDAEAGTSTDLAGFLALVGITLPEFKTSHSSPLAVTPRLSSYSITPSTVTGSTATTSGDSVTFMLSVDSVNYLGAYAIDSIELFRKKPSAGSFILESVPAPCARIAPTPGQAAFTCRTVLPAAWSGTQDVYAFVKARTFGVPLPTALELSNDGKAQVTVETGSVTVSPPSVTLANGQTQTFTAAATGLSSQAVVWSATGGTIDAAGVYTAGNTTGNFIVVARSAVNATIADTAEVIVNASTSIAINPDTVTVFAGRTYQFNAVVTGADSSSVVWSATGGTITSSGLYTASTTLGTFSVTARIAGAADSATATVIIAQGGRAVIINSESNPGGGSIKLLALNEASPSTLCAVDYVAPPGEPLPATTQLYQCTTTGASSSASWTLGIPADSVPFSLTARMPGAASVDGGAFGQRTRANVSGRLVIVFEVLDGPVQYHLTGSLTVTGYQGTDWMVWARTTLAPAPSGAAIEDAYAGSLPDPTPGPLSVSLNRTGVLQPGLYRLLIATDLGHSVFGSSQEFQTQTRAGTALADIRLVVSNP